MLIVVNERHMFWQPWDEPGFEHLHLRVSSDAVVADSIVVGIDAGEPFRVRYVLRCDEHYRVRDLLLQRLGSEERIVLHADGCGHWTDENGTPLPELDGCIDVDISATPFTNTLPIRRLQLLPGEASDIHVVYVAVPALHVRVAPQRYTCLEQHANGATWQYRSLGSDFVANLPVDNHGLVIDYPHLFRRLS
jgi:hypothetical protein